MIIDSEFVLLPFLVTVILYSIFRVIIFRNRTCRCLLIDLLLLIYIFLVIKLLYFPLVIHSGSSAAVSYHMNLIPFKSILFTKMSLGNLAGLFGNLLLFVPLTIYVALRIPQYPALGVVIIFIVAAAAEPIQYFLMVVTHSRNRVIDIDDLILNLLGSMVAWLIIRKYLYGFAIRNTKNMAS